MTISTTENKVSYEGNGALTEFTFLFKVLSVGHIKVYLDDALQGSGYTVNLNPDQTSDPGGSVEFDTAPADGATVTLLRSVPIDQLVDYTPYDPFPAETHEGALDKLTMITQQLQEQVGRAIIQPPSSEGTITLPTYNAGKGLMWSETESGVMVNTDDNINGIVARATSEADRSRDEADRAQGYADDAEDTLAEFRCIYHPASSTPPTECVDVGDLWYDTDSAILLIYDGAEWKPITAAANVVKTEIIASEGQTDFTIPPAEAGTEIITINGALISPSDYTRPNAATVRLNEPATESDVFYCIVNTLVNASDFVLKDGDTMTGTLVCPTYDAAGNNIFAVDGTERMRIDSSGNLQFNSGYGSVATAYGCRAYGYISSAGSLAAGKNVSSSTKTATGQYTANLTNALPDSNWCVTANGRAANRADAILVTASYISTSQIGFNTFLANVAADRDFTFQVVR